MLVLYSHLYSAQSSIVDSSCTYSTGSQIRYMSMGVFEIHPYQPIMQLPYRQSAR